MKRIKPVFFFFILFYMFLSDSDVYTQDTESNIKRLIEFKLEGVVAGIGKPDDIEGCRNEKELLKINRCRRAAKQKAEEDCKAHFNRKSIDSLREKGFFDEKFLEELTKKEGKERIRIGIFRSSLEVRIIESYLNPKDDKPDECLLKCRGEVKFSEDFKQRLIAMIKAPETCSLTVIIKPEAIRNTAKWRIDNGNWNNSGETVSELPAGTHTIEFGAVDGWMTPKSKSVFIEKSKNLLTEGFYQKEIRTGSLTLIIVPEAIRNAAKWRIDNGNWNKSGETVSELPPEPHIIEFGTVDGWITPKSKSVTIEKNKNLLTEGLYQKEIQAGSLTLTIVPEAIRNAAKWRIDKGNWNKSGETVSELPRGTHTVEFKTIDGWIAPENQIVIIEKDRKLSTEGLYRKKLISGSLTVTIEPPEAVRNGAKWRMDGGNWHNSGEMIPKISAGTHTIEFGSLDGWISPDSQIVTIKEDKGSSEKGRYEQKTSSDDFPEKNVIIKQLLREAKGYLEQYKTLCDNETKGQDVRNEIISILTNMIDTLKRVKKIYEDIKDPEFEKRIRELGERISKYEAEMNYYLRKEKK